MVEDIPFFLCVFASLCEAKTGLVSHQDTKTQSRKISGGIAALPALMGWQDL
jgi:hypothetical protein